MKTPLLDRPTHVVNSHRACALAYAKSKWQLSLTDGDKNVNLFLWDRGRLTLKQLETREIDEAREVFIFNQLVR